MADQYVPGEFEDTPPIAGMIPWVCEYRSPTGDRMGITLYGSDAKQVLEDNAAELPGLIVNGQQMAVASAVLKTDDDN